MTDVAEAFDDLSVFEDAEPLAQKVVGRQAEPNPYVKIVSMIALKTNEETGKPIAKAFKISHTAENREKTIGKIRRQMSEAGAVSTPPVTVKLSFQKVPVDGRGKPVEDPAKAKGESEELTKVTFWTVERQTRQRKSKTEVSDGNAEAAE